MKTRWIVLLLAPALILAACSPSQPIEEDPSSLEPQAPAAQQFPTLTPENPIKSVSTPEVSDMPTNAPPIKKFVELAKKDLISRLEADSIAVNLVRSEEILWPNSALGCPEPGKTYAQGRVPGFRIWLESGGVEYDYHTDWLGQVILCADPGLDLDTSYPTNTGPTPQIGVPID